MELKKIHPVTVLGIIIAVCIAGIVLPANAQWFLLVSMGISAILLERMELNDRSGLSTLVLVIMVAISMQSLLVMVLWLTEMQISLQNMLYTNTIVSCVLVGMEIYRSGKNRMTKKTKVV